MPKELEECVKKVKKEEKERYGYEKYNPYAVCHNVLDEHTNLGQHLHRHHKKHKDLDKHMNVYRD